MRAFTPLFLLSALILTSCAKDEKTTSTLMVSDIIEGRWSAVYWALENGTDSINGLQIATISAVGRDFEGGLTFNGDGSYFDDLGLTVDGERIEPGLPPEIETQTFSAIPYNGTYNLTSGNQIALSSDPTQVYTVSETSSTNMTWKTLLRDTRVENGDTIITTVTNVLRFKKD